MGSERIGHVHDSRDRSVSTAIVHDDFFDNEHVHHDNQLFHDHLDVDDDLHHHLDVDGDLYDLHLDDLHVDGGTVTTSARPVIAALSCVGLRRLATSLRHCARSIGVSPQTSSSGSEWGCSGGGRVGKG